MAHVNFDRVKETSTTTGTGSLTLAGAVDGAHRTFASVCSTSDTFFYCIEDLVNGAWETGLGTYSGTNTLARTSVKASSNAGSAVNLGAGTKFVFMTPIAFMFPTGAAGFAASGAVTSSGLTQSTARMLGRTTASTGAIEELDAAAVRNFAGVIGKQAIWIPASAMVSRTTNGAAAGSAEMTTNKNMVVTLDFDTSTQEFAQFAIAMPSSWNEGTVTFVPYWSHASTSTNFGVVWQLAGVAVSNDDALDVAYGTAQTSTDTGGTTNDIYVGPESSAITIAGTPATSDLVMFQVARVPANGSDTMAIDARLHGIVLFITTNDTVDS